MTLSREVLCTRLKRLPGRRKRVTLIAEFPTPLGFAICADSQETVTEYDPAYGSYEVRVTVQKIAPITAGKYQIAVCGGGNAGLIEGFIAKAQRALQEQDAVVCTQANPAGIMAVHRRMEEELSRFYLNDVASCPDADKSFKLFVAASCPLTAEYAVWTSENAVLRNARSDGPELNGWNHRLYEETAKRLYSPNMTMSQAVLASIYVLNIAKDSSNWVKDPFSLITIDANGIHIEKESYVQTISNRLDEYETWMNRIFISCADTTVSVPELEDLLDQFKQSALRLHRQHIDRQADAMTLKEFLQNSLKKLPKGPIHYYENDKFVVEHDRKEIEATREKAKKVELLGGGGPFNLTVHCKCGTDFKVKVTNELLFKSTKFACAKCQFVNVIEGVALEDVTEL
jgi:hypothetical protein